MTAIGYQSGYQWPQAGPEGRGQVRAISPMNARDLNRTGTPLREGDFKPPYAALHSNNLARFHSTEGDSGGHKRTGTDALWLPEWLPVASPLNHQPTGSEARPGGRVVGASYRCAEGRAAPRSLVRRETDRGDRSASVVATAGAL